MISDVKDESLMKPTIYLSLLAMLNMAACALEPTPPVEPPPKISTFIPPVIPVSPIPPSAKAALPLPKVMNQIVYFYGGPPEKQVIDFKRVADADHYFSLLSQKLRPRHGTVDAKAARDAGIFYLLTDNPSHGRSLDTMTIIYSRGDHSQYGSEPITDPATNCYINRLQGYQYYFKYPKGTTIYMDNVEKFREYLGTARQYSVDWNYIMLPACSNRTGDFKKPPDQRPK